MGNAVIQHIIVLLAAVVVLTLSATLAIIAHENFRLVAVVLAIHRIVLASSAFEASSDTILDALEGTPPFKIEEGEEHEGESNVDSDNDGPVGKLFFIFLDDNFAIVELKRAASTANIWLAACNNPDFIRALEQDLLVSLGLFNILRCDNYGYKLRLILPKVWPVVA